MTRSIANSSASVAPSGASPAAVQPPSSRAKPPPQKPGHNTRTEGLARAIKALEPIAKFGVVRTHEIALWLTGAPSKKGYLVAHKACLILQKLGFVKSVPELRGAHAWILTAKGRRAFFAEYGWTAVQPKGSPQLRDTWHHQLLVQQFLINHRHFGPTLSEAQIFAGAGDLSAQKLRYVGYQIPRSKKQGDQLFRMVAPKDYRAWRDMYTGVLDEKIGFEAARNLSGKLPDGLLLERDGDCWLLSWIEAEYADKKPDELDRLMHLAWLYNRRLTVWHHPAPGERNPDGSLIKPEGCEKHATYDGLPVFFHRVVFLYPQLEGKPVRGRGLASPVTRDHRAALLRAIARVFDERVPTLSAYAVETLGKPAWTKAADVLAHVLLVAIASNHTRLLPKSMSGEVAVKLRAEWLRLAKVTPELIAAEAAVEDSANLPDHVDYVPEPALPPPSPAVVTVPAFVLETASAVPRAKVADPVLAIANEPEPVVPPVSADVRPDFELTTSPGAHVSTPETRGYSYYDPRLSKDAVAALFPNKKKSA